MNFILYKHEVFVVVIFQLLSRYFSSTFSTFFIDYFVAQCVFCIGSVAMLRFVSVFQF